MKRWERLLWKIVLWHFGLTVGTGLLWTALNVAVYRSYHAPFVLATMYASFWLFIPFCQPFFWPMSDWAVRSEHLAVQNSELFWQIVKYTAIAFVNSLTAVIALFGAVWLVQFALSHPRKSPEA